MTTFIHRIFMLCLSAMLLLGSAQTMAQEAQAAAPAAPATEVHAVVNPYGIDALWAQGDIVARGTLVILLLMSAATWYVGITKFVQQARLLGEGKRLKAGGSPVSQRLQALPKTSPYHDILQSGVQAGEQLRNSKSGRLDIDSWVANAVADAGDRIANYMQNGMTVLATVGATAPFVGLFGTVWGIYHALTAIGIAGQASIDKVAGPVGEALIMTAIGLAVAVPAVLGYNWLLRRNKQVVEQARFYGGQLHSEVVLGVAG